MATIADDAVLAKIEFIEDGIRHTDLRHASVQAELSKAKDALEHAQRAVDCLSAEQASLIACRLALAKNLADERSSLKRAHGQAKAARIQKILALFPPELLQAVFLEATNCVENVWPDGETWYWCFETEHTTLPFTLAAVNRRWREVALETPAIWTFLGVRLIRDQDRSAVLGYVKQLLSRSRGRPLDIFLDWTGSNWQESNGYKNILDAVGRHINRWRRASVTLPNNTPEDALDFLRLPMPRLEYLHLHAEEVTTLSLPLSAYLPFCPRLRRLHNFAIYAVPRQPMMDLVSVDVEIDGTSIGHVWTMLRVASSVRELHIKFVSQPEGGLAGPPGSLVLPNLLEFGIYGCYESYMPWIHHLGMSRLHTIYVEGFHAAEPLSTTFDKVANTVTTLIVYGDAEDELVTMDDMPYIRKLHNLRCLIIRECTGVGPDMCSLFGSREASGLPHLESIVIEDPTLDDEQAAYVSEFMQTLHAQVASGAEGAISFKLQIEADDGDVPKWLLQQYKFITGDGDGGDVGASEGEVGGSPAASNAQFASGSESEEAEFTDGDSSGEAYTSDASWEESDDDSPDIMDETVDD